MNSKPTIILISTMHRELGKCNSDELCSIFERIEPDVIFLEALEDTYSNYQQFVFNNFRVYHQKLELAAIQKYVERYPVEYIPVLDKGLPDSFNERNDKLDKILELEALAEYQKVRIKIGGFDYLNSKECSDHNKKMREREKELLDDINLETLFNRGIEEYENSMMRNIYAYCKTKQFEKAVFLCGNAHRSSIINKMEFFNSTEGIQINWEIYEGNVSKD